MGFMIIWTNVLVDFQTVFNVNFLKSQNEQKYHYKTVAICLTSMTFTLYVFVIMCKHDSWSIICYIIGNVNVLIKYGVLASSTI